MEMALILQGEEACGFTLVLHFTRVVFFSHSLFHTRLLNVFVYLLDP